MTDVSVRSSFVAVALVFNIDLAMSDFLSVSYIPLEFKTLFLPFSYFEPPALYHKPELCFAEEQLKFCIALAVSMWSCS